MSRGMTDELHARMMADARRILGLARCAACGRIMKVAEDDVLEAREELRDEGWVETREWDGDDRTALTHWVCCD